MPLYLTRFSYTPETWARLIGNPEDCRNAAQSYIESVGGKLHGFWYAFGTHDGYNFCEAPNNVSMAAVALAISGGGALSSLETTVLLTVEETMDALRKAQQVQYRAPAPSHSARVSRDHFGQLRRPEARTSIDRCLRQPSIRMDGASSSARSGGVTSSNDIRGLLHTSAASWRPFASPIGESLEETPTKSGSF